MVKVLSSKELYEMHEKLDDLFDMAVQPLFNTNEPVDENEVYRLEHNRDAIWEFINHANIELSKRAN